MLSVCDNDNDNDIELSRGPQRVQEEVLARGVEEFAEHVDGIQRLTAATYEAIAADMNNRLECFDRWEAEQPAAVDRFRDQQQETLQLGKDIAQLTFDLIERDIDGLRNRQIEQNPETSEDAALIAPQKDAEDRIALLQAIDTCARTIDQQTTDLDRQMIAARNEFEQALRQDDQARQQLAIDQLLSEQASRAEIWQQASERLKLLADSDRVWDYQAIRVQCLTNAAEAVLAEARHQQALFATPNDEEINSLLVNATCNRTWKTPNSTAPKKDPLVQDIALNIDEILPVGDRNVSLADRRIRALGLNNRQMLEAVTNQRSKHLGVDSRDVQAVSVSRDPVSLEVDPSALFSRRFSEIHELNLIGLRALDGMPDKITRDPCDLKKDLNRRIWDEIRNPTTDEGRIVASAIRQLGFGYVEAPGGDVVLRALSQEELRLRGYNFLRGRWVTEE